MVFCRNSYQGRIDSPQGLNISRRCVVGLCNWQEGSLPVGDDIKQQQGVTASFHNRGERKFNSVELRRTGKETYYVSR